MGIIVNADLNNIAYIGSIASPPWLGVQVGVNNNNEYVLTKHDIFQSYYKYLL